MKYPEELYVWIDGTGADQFLNAQESAEVFAIPNGSVQVALYRKIGMVNVKSPVQLVPIGKQK